MSIVTLKYEDLLSDKDLSGEIYKAYGPDGLGALTVSGIPGYVEKRLKLLKLAHKLAHLPEEEQKKLEHKDSMYNAGWSLGKEKIGDKPDLAKGSFYANPLFDKAALSEEELKKFPWACPNNIWPTDTIPEMEPAFKDLGKLMYEVIVHLTKHIDKFTASKVENYDPHLMHNALSKTRKIKGRLLYYYPQKDRTEEDSWIGWHNDTGFLTGLSSALFVDDADGKPIDNPDPNGGLWIVDRSGGSVRVKIPADEMAIQCGECLQIVTGGLLVATPHCVRASQPKDATKIGRAAFPVFVDTSPEFPLSMPRGCKRDQIFDKTVNSKVPPLEDRWKEDGVIFADFLGKSFEQYYKWAMGDKAK